MTMQGEKKILRLQNYAMIVTLLFFLTDLAVEAKLMKVVAQEGSTVTLQPQTPKLLSNDRVTWMFTPAKPLSNKSEIVYSHEFKKEVHTEYKGIFQDSLLLDRKTGSLTIRNISISQSGLYHLLLTGVTVTEWNFNCTVYVPVSVPDISKGTFQLRPPSRSGGQPLPSSSCQVLCSVRNGRDVSLFWYKDNDLLSSTNTPDVTSTLSLRLDLDDQDNGTYSCVTANPVSNHTTSLNITAVCSSGQQPDASLPRSYVYSLLVISMLIACAIVTTALYWKRKMTHNPGTAQELEESSYADLKYRHTKDQKQDASHRTEHTPETIYSAVVT